MPPGLVLTNTLVGFLGIGLAFLWRGRSRFMFWVMVGSGVFLFVPLGFELLFRAGLFGSYLSYIYVLLRVLLVFYGLRWAAYGLLVLGPLALTFSRSDDPSLTGATLPDRFDSEPDADASTEDSGEGKA